MASSHPSSSHGFDVVVEGVTPFPGPSSAAEDTLAGWPAPLTPRMDTEDDACLLYTSDAADDM
eukprot:6078886-Alexandrium_andersonii.AAC.1